MTAANVGRHKERAVAAALVERARAGSSQPLLITGEPGSGKSTLLEAVVDGAARSGFRAIVAAADPSDSGIGYAPLRLAMEPMLSTEQSPALTELARSLNSGLRAVVGAGEPANGSGRVTELLRRMLTGWAAREPLLLALDDLHAADPDTAAAIFFLVRHLRNTRIFVCAATRTDPPDLDPARLETLRRFEVNGAVDVIDLAPLDEDDLAQLVETNLGLPPDPALLSVLAEYTAGNPFFAIEIVRELEATGQLNRVDHHIAIDSSVLSALPHPRTVDAVVVQRVARLGHDVRTIASAAAVLGSVPADRLELLAALAGFDRHRSDEAFDALVRAKIVVRTDDRFRFAHPVVREALYRDLGPAARRRHHDQVAKILAANRVAGGGLSVVEIATHARLGATPPDATSATLLLEAGDTAIASAPRSAARWYRDALTLLPKDHPAVTEIRLKLSMALGFGAQHGEAAEVATVVVDALPDGPQRAHAVVLAGHSLRWADRYDEAAVLLDQALSVPSMRLAPLLLHRAHMAAWYEEFALAEELLSEAGALGVDDQDQALAEAVAMHLHFAAGNYGEGFAAARSIRDRLDRMSPVTRTDALVSLTTVAALNGDPRDVAGYADQLELVQRMPDWSAALRSFALYRMGRWNEAIRVASQALGAADEGNEPNLPAVGVLIAARAELGDFDAADAALALVEGIVGNRKIPDCAEGLLATFRGDYSQARTCLEPLVKMLSQSGRVNFTMPLALLAEVAWRSGDHAEARAYNADLQALPSHADAVAHTELCLLSQALVHGDADAASAARDYAVEHDLAADAATALGLLGAIRDDADQLIEAYHALDELGAAMRQRDVVHQLRRLGRRPPRHSSRSGRLSARELELARLVSRGLTNRQIAEATKLTLHTVEVYLSRLYAKTGCRSRVELAMAVNEGRLGTDNGS